MKWLENINTKQKMEQLLSSIHHLMHVVLIFLTLWVVVVFNKNPVILVKVEQYLSSITNLIAHLPFVQIATYLSEDKVLINSYLSLLYMLAGAIFLNLYFASKPFKKALQISETFEKSAGAFFIVTSLNVYNACFPSFAIVGAQEKARYEKNILDGNIKKFDIFVSDQVLTGRLKNYCLGMFFVAFIFLPSLTILHLYIKDSSFGFFTFWFSGLAMVFVQVRFITDIFLIIRSIYLTYKGQ